MKDGVIITAIGGLAAISVFTQSLGGCLFLCLIIGLIVFGKDKEPQNNP